MSIIPWLSIIAILFGILNWIAIPYFTKKITADLEKERKHFQYDIALNQLKEKWLNYFREVIENYLALCHQLCYLRESQNTYSASSIEKSINLAEEFHQRINTCQAKIEAKETRVRLLFGKDSTVYPKLVPLLKLATENADKSDRKKLRETQKDIEMICLDILDERWKIIENLMAFDDLLD